MSELIFTTDAAGELERLVAEIRPDRIFIVTPRGLRGILLAKVCGKWSDRATALSITDDEEHKTLDSAEVLWRHMLEADATRHSLIVNIGGGVTTDLGGFAAACYMRGIRYLNVPTTLLAMVDASTGGKTGVNLDGVKNIVGAFRQPLATVVCPAFLDTLPERELLSGYGEMLKHALLCDRQSVKRIISLSPRDVSPGRWLGLIQESVEIKRKTVESDPLEQGLRKMLNLGHTAGHAIESLSHSGLWDPAPLSHGHAVALGLIAALVLSHTVCGFPSDILQELSLCVKETYPAVPLKCSHYDELYRIMRHDKKNDGSGSVSFCLLKEPGKPVLSQPVAKEDIFAALDIMRDLTGI